MIGKILAGHYKVIKALGSGGFGQTYVAEDTHRPGNPQCVVKHLKPASSSPQVLQTARRLFNSEAQVLEKLGTNDQIPRLLAYFEEDGEFYLVQEFIDGHTLTSEIAPGQRWSETQVKAMLEDVLGILEFVHAQGVIHRDIKPDNIMRRASDNKLVLIDFGAIKEVGNQGLPQSGQVSNTVVIGTPGYMPTEQGRGKPRPSSDIYSLGMVAIQAVTGIYPQQLREDKNTGEIIWQSQAEISPDLAAVLTEMTRYHFKDRYKTAREVLDALSGGYQPTKVSGLPADVPVPEPTLVQQPIPTPQPPTRQKGGKLPLLVGIGVALLLCAGGGFAYVQAENARQQQQIAEEQAEEQRQQQIAEEQRQQQIAEEQRQQQIAEERRYRLARERQNQLGKQKLAQARQKAESERFLEAISLAQEVPSDSNSYQAAQTAIELWKRDLRDRRQAEAEAERRPSISPEEFVKTYYANINFGDYRKAWDMLSPRLKNDSESHPEGYSSYLDWWTKVKRVNVIDSQTIKVNSHAIVETDLQYFLRSGREIDQTLRFSLSVDATGKNWYLDRTEKVR
ncbi:MAG: protein kinase [Oscillatoria sp. SIO1A7]|nr:protein kinase [Oscillatoria sp. SIO1A7]